MADRRIVEKTGLGIICFISNYSWLKGRSHPAMRERYLSAFDCITIDSLNGDKFRTGKVSPDGLPDPSIFSTESNPEGIGLGTAITLSLVRKPNHAGQATVLFRDLWGTGKRAQLLQDAERSNASYVTVTPRIELRLPFSPVVVNPGYLSWPKLPELFPYSSPGVNTSRDLDLVDIDAEKLRDRIRSYFDPKISDRDVERITPSLLSSSGRFDPIATRRQLLSLGMDKGQFVPYAYRPFDLRWLYWYPHTKLLDEKREDLFNAFKKGALFITSRAQAERSDEGSPFYASRSLPDRHLTREWGPHAFRHATNRRVTGPAICSNLRLKRSEAAIFPPMRWRIAPPSVSTQRKPNGIREPRSRQLGTARSISPTMRTAWSWTGRVFPFLNRGTCLLVQQGLANACCDCYLLKRIFPESPKVARVQIFAVSRPLNGWIGGLLTRTRVISPSMSGGAIPVGMGSLCRARARWNSGHFRRMNGSSRSRRRHCPYLAKSRLMFT